MMNYDLLQQAMADLEEDTVKELINQIEDEESAGKAIACLQKGLAIVGERLEACDYFLGDLVFAGTIMTNAIKKLSPLIDKSEQEKSLGRVLLCTVEGDLHDIGKNLVSAYLKAAKIEVIDLGVNVAAQEIATAAVREDVDIIALSGVLTFSVETMKRTVDALQSLGLRKRFRVIVGGLCINQAAFDFIGADAWTVDAAECAAACQEWLKNTK